MGVITKLDKFGSSSTLKIIKRSLKHRFWVEIYRGAKIFYLSSNADKLYKKKDVLNLSKFISVYKFRCLTWRRMHPYLLIDRIKDITVPCKIKNTSRINRRVALYGLLRGSYLSQRKIMHIAGIGDFNITKIHCFGDSYFSYNRISFIEQDNLFKIQLKSQEQS